MLTLKNAQFAEIEEQQLKATKFVDGKKYFTVTPNGNKKPVADKAAFDDLIGDGVDVFEEHAASEERSVSASNRSNRPKPRKDISDEVRVQIRTSSEQEAMAVPQRLSDLGESATFTGKVLRFDEKFARETGNPFLATQIEVGAATDAQGKTHVINPPAIFQVLENANDVKGGEIKGKLQMVETRNGPAMGVTRA